MNRIAFNIVGLFIAALFTLAALSTLFVVMPGTPPEARTWWHFMVALEAMAALSLGVGAIVNLAGGRRLAPWPTGIMIFGYCVTMWLLPLALWGVISLVVEHKRRRKEKDEAQPADAPNERPALPVEAR